MENKLVKAILTRLSICDCGFPLLKEDIPLGTEYNVHPHTIRKGMTYICGGCGVKQTDLEAIYVDPRPGTKPAPPMPLPTQVFTFCNGDGGSK